MQPRNFLQDFELLLPILGLFVHFQNALLRNRSRATTQRIDRNAPANLVAGPDPLLSPCDMPVDHCHSMHQSQSQSSSYLLALFIFLQVEKRKSQKRIAEAK